MEEKKGKNRQHIGKEAEKTERERNGTGKEWRREKEETSEGE